MKRSGRSPSYPKLADSPRRSPSPTLRPAAPISADRPPRAPPQGRGPIAFAPAISRPGHVARDGAPCGTPSASGPLSISNAVVKSPMDQLRKVGLRSDWIATSYETAGGGRRSRLTRRAMVALSPRKSRRLPLFDPWQELQRTRHEFRRYHGNLADDFGQHLDFERIAIALGRFGCAHVCRAPLR